MKILFQSADVIIVHKPAGYLSVPSNMGKSDSRPVVGIELRKTFGSVYPVHRLDFEVEGILLFAKNPKSQAVLHKLWEKKSVQKTYEALTLSRDFSNWPEKVAGADRSDVLEQGDWKSLIVQGKKRSFIADYGAASLTAFKRREDEHLLHWTLNPVTGRRHQLRLELSRHGFPILGDELYGSRVTGPKDRIALVASGVIFEETMNLDLPKQIHIDWDSKVWKKVSNP